MGTTSEKLTYLNNTKQLLKDKINNLGGDIDNNTTFRNYANQLDTIYDLYPKTSYQEGSSITLENCNKGKLDFEDDKVGYGDTEQNGTPTPTTPISINTVTGEQDVTIRGKNKLKINDVTLTSNGVTLTVQDNYFILNGTNNGTESVFQLSNYITPFKTNSNTKLKAFQISGTASGNLLNTFFRTYSNWANQVNINFTQTTMSSYSAELTYNNCMLALAGGTYTDYKIGIMVADNLTSDDTFENYITPITKTLNLGNIELAKIGTYRDYIWTDRSTKKWYKHSAIGKVVLNGTEEWTNDTNGQRFIVVLTNSWQYNIRNEVISNYFKYISSGSAEGGCFNYGSKLFIYYFQDITTATAFKEWLSTHNTTVYYVLETATDTEITDTTLISQLEEIYNIMSLNGTTIIEINGNLPMIIKVRALKGE